MFKFKVFSGLFALLVATSCHHKNDAASTQGFVLRDSAWPEGIASVCWASDERAEWREYVKTIVVAQFKKSPMRFTEWKPCSEVPDANVRFEFKEEFIARGASDVGNGSIFSLKKYKVAGPNKATMIIRSKSRKNCSKMPECLRFTILHEFGHAAGLLHEHSRLDTNQECYDKLTKAGNSARDEEEEPDYPELSGERVGKFDEKSIMNYCHPSRNTANLVGLSVDDFQSLESLYGLPQKQAPQEEDDETDEEPDEATDDGQQEDSSTVVE